MTAATRIVTGEATAAAAAGVTPEVVAGYWGTRSVVPGAGLAATGEHPGGFASRRAGAATVHDLLRARAHLPAGDPDRDVLRARSIEAGLPLAWRLAGRYRGRGEPLDDLYQVAALALVKAVDAFDPARQAEFSSYAVPSIVGALKRHFRDSTWRLRVPRPIHDLAVRLAPAAAGLAQQLGRSPTLTELAAHLRVTEDEVVAARDAWRAHHPASLDALSAVAGQDPRPLADTIGVVDARLDAVLDRHTLQPLLAALPDGQRRILVMRYLDELSQAEIAAQVGLSQMRISRLLVRTLTQLRAGLLAGQSPRPARRAPDDPTALGG